MNKRVAGLISRILTIFIILITIVLFVLTYKLINHKEVSILGMRIYYVVTNSMEPTIPTNSFIVVKDTDTSKLKVNDIISFESRDPAIQGYINTHRIYSIATDENGKTCFVTKGDKNSSIDNYLVYPEDVKGKVVLHTIALKKLVEVMQVSSTKNGFLIFIVIPILIITILYLNSFIKEFKNITKANKEALKLLETQMSDAKEGNKDDFANHINSMTPEQAKLVIELYTGKKYEELTDEEISGMLNSEKYRSSEDDETEDQNGG